MCVRDEEAFIGANLAYHHALGVSRAYIFADRCQDATIEIAESFPWVKVFKSHIDPSLAIVVHQNKRADEALEMARNEGFHWLMHLDADEFAFADNLPLGIFGRKFSFPKKIIQMKPVERGNLIKMLANVKRKTEMVLMRTWESVPIISEKEKKFWENKYFHNKPFEGEKILDPVTNKMESLHWFGHARGKTIIRTEADVQSYNPHLWTRNQGKLSPEKIPIPNEYRGRHFHFLFTNPREWQNKYRKHAEFPDRWYSNNRPVGFPKQSWKEISTKMTNEEAAKYFNEWLAMNPAELTRQLSKGKVIRETAVEDVLKESKWVGLSNI